MAFRVTSDDYEIKMVSGDTEYIRLNIKDSNGDIVDLSQSTSCRIGIKRHAMDGTFIVPEKMATMYAYDEYEQPFSIEFKFEAADTTALLNYNGKERKRLECYYDIELTITDVAEDEISTILQGKLVVSRSISGRVI